MAEGAGGRSWAVQAGWQLADTAPGACEGPAQLPADLPWRAAVVPGTVAQALDLGPGGGVDLDGRDWWYRCRLELPQGVDPARLWLRCEGLATLARAWLDGAPLLASDSMFLPVSVPLPPGPASRELVLCFRSLDAALAARRPRPRWKVALVDHQNLRWFRTTLLGRMPGWTPPLHPVGPWRAVHLVEEGPVEVQALRPRVEGGVPRLLLRLRVAEGVRAARLVLGEQVHPLPLAGDRVEVDLSLPGLPLWWPHTHGRPDRVQATLELEEADGLRAVPLGRLGFRAVEVDRADGAVRFVINGQPVFCRGACWSAEEVRTLDGAPGATAATLARAAAAGLNMLRLPGVTTWASEELVEACDALGVLLWQDLPLANMDYPLDDPAWGALLRAEVAHHTRRLERSAAVVAFCGGSEIQQQAALLGLPPALWSHPYYDEELPRRVAETHPGAACFPSSPCEGALPVHVGEGIAHYYGVGAYLRPLSDLRTAGVRFAAECLAFAHVPGPEAVAEVFGGDRPAPHDPRWKAGLPRDRGAGWDFEDVRDHYLRLLWGVDPVGLRSLDPERYLALSRAVSGELLLRAYAAWRRPGSGCGGALAWLLKDLVPGAGWGVLDSQGRPKAAWWALRRAWAPQAVLLTDEGLDGVAVHVHNEGPAPLAAAVELSLWRSGARAPVAEGRAEVALPPQTSRTLAGDALLGRFTDLGHAWRFGPPAHQVVLARLIVDGRTAHQDALFPGGHGLPVLDEAGLEGHLEGLPDGGARLRLRAAAFLQGVHLQAPGWQVDDDHFHLAPGADKQVLLRPLGASPPPRVRVEALNLAGGVTVRLA